MAGEQQVRPVTLSYASGRSSPLRSSRVPTILYGLAAFVVFSLFIAAFVIPTTSHDRRTCPTSLARANMQGLISPLELYRLHVGTYPVSLDDLYRLPTGLTQEAWGGPYMDDSYHLKDAWGRPYYYRAPGVKNPKWYDLWSAGKDGVYGTKDDVKNW